jgi:hypothetical protein
MPFLRGQNCGGVGLSRSAALRPGSLDEPFELPPGFGLQWQAKRDTAFGNGLDNRMRHVIQKRRRRCALPAQSKKSMVAPGLHAQSEVNTHQSPSRRKGAIETLVAVGRLRVGELELAGGNFRDTAQRCPVGQRQRQVRGGQHAEQGAHAVGEAELE